MSDDRVETTTHTTGPAAAPGHTTIIERRGGSAGLLIGLALLIAVVVGAFFLFNESRNDTIRTDAVTDAAKSVGDGAQKVGDAAQDAAQKVAPAEGE